MGLGCGYHVAGQADTIPDEIRTIAIPAFTNGTTEFKIEQYLTEAVTREFMARTRYSIVTNPDYADATLNAKVLGFDAYPANYDPQTNRASTINTTIRLYVTLVDKHSGQVLYQNPNLSHRDRYEVSSDTLAYFEERQVALTRSSESMARTIVSAVLEGF